MATIRFEPDDNFDCVATDQGLVYMDILFDYKRVIRFKVGVRED